MAKLIGNNPSQIPTNGDLGSMAFEDKKNYATISSSIHQPYRNIIINGDMSIAQRGTSTSGITSTGYHTVDRFETKISSAGTFTQSQDTDVPSGQGFSSSLKMDCTTANGSLASGSRLSVRQKFEGQNLQYLKKGTSNAKSLTASFWVKSNKTGTYICEVFDVDNQRQISQTYTIDSADTWEKKTLLYPADISGALGNDNENSLQISWWLSAGSSFSSGTLSKTWTSNNNSNRAVGQVNLADSTANEWYITGVQLEAGTTASDFEFLPYDVNLQRCQRYCYSESAGDTYHNYVNGFLSSTTLFIGNLNLPTSMRAGPSITTSGSFAVAGTTGHSVTSFSIVDSNVNDVNTIQIRAVTSGAPAGEGASIRNDNDATATFILSSEL